MVRRQGDSPASDPVETLRYVSFNQLRSFHAVARAGGVTRAAQMLHVTQPTVTIQLRQLESAYGVELVHRTPRSVRLTDIGRELYAITERIFALEREAVDLLQNAYGLLTGELHVGGVGPYFVMRLLAEFRGLYPGIHIALSLGNSHSILASLVEYRNDVAVVGRPVGGAEATDRRFKVVPFSRQPVVLFVHNSHPWAVRQEVDIGELADEPMVMREHGSVSRQALEQALSAASVEPKTVLEVNREGVWEAVAAGLGVGMTTEAEFRADDKVHMVRLRDAVVQTEAIVVGLQDRADAPLVGAFLQLAETMSEMPQGDDAL
ncbi:MAG: LysR substrate-binding domain-containing protein [Phycisphaeraceae bacterium]